MVLHTRNYLYIILFFNVIASILILDKLKATILFVESFVAIIVVIISLFIVYDTNQNNARNRIFYHTFFTIMIYNHVSLYFLQDSFVFLLIALLNLVGLYTTIFGFKKQKRIMKYNMHKTTQALKKELNNFKKTDEPKIIVEEISSKKAKSVKKQFVSSKRSKLYHKTTCTIAKKIPAKNKEFYESNEMAEKSGLKPHDCIN